MKREDIVLQDAGAGKGKRIAIFPGAFDPFTKGHASLVERGLLMVDEIIIAIGINGSKSELLSIAYGGFCKASGCRVHIKGNPLCE